MARAERPISMSMLVAATIVALGCGGTAAPTTPNGPSARVVFGRTVRVHFSGNRLLPEATLRTAVKIDKVEPKDETTPDRILARDGLEITALYYDHGYMQAEIGRPTVSEASEGPFVDVTFHIKREGTRFRIGRLTAYERDDPNGPKILGDNDVRARIRPVSGDWFSRITLVEDLQRLRTFYRDRGYANVEATPETEIDPRQGMVDVVIPIERGPIVKVETVVVTGNGKTPLERIKTEIRLNEGDTYSETRLEETKKHLAALFEKVEVTTEQGSAPWLMKITFEVTEK